MERETKTLTTPVSKIKVIVKSYLTGRELRMINDLMYKNVTFKGVGKETQADGFKADLMDKVNDKVFEILVISVDEKTEGINSAILDMQLDDYNFIIKELDKIRGIGKNEDDEKKTA